MSQPQRPIQIRRKGYTSALPTTIEAYLETELHPKLTKIAVRASFSKRMFFVLRTLSVLGAAALPFLISYGDNKTLSVGVSLVVALAVAIEQAFNFKENYVKMEGVIHAVNKLKGDFVAGGNEFENLEEKDKIRKFTILSEAIILNSRNSLLEAYKNMELPKGPTA